MTCFMCLCWLSVVPGLGIIWFMYGQLDTAVTCLWCALLLEQHALGCTRWCCCGGGLILGRLHSTGYVDMLMRLTVFFSHLPLDQLLW